MKDILIVGFGGFLGAVSRYKLGGIILHNTVNHRFPYSTFTINLIGCLLIGFLAGLAERHHLINPQIKLLLITGILGGFTTFSSFSLESIFLIKRGEFFIALLYGVLSLILGVTLAYFGDYIALKLIK